MSVLFQVGLIFLSFSVHLSEGCTNFLIPAGSTVDGSTILSYSADSSFLFGALDHWPAAKHGPGDLREIFSWDWGTRLGAIPQPEETYNVVGNANEHQLSITETTFGGLKSLAGSRGRAVCNTEYGCIDYGQLIWVTLQRAKSVREAISTVDYLLQTYGYASEGESFSLADPTEVWIMEIIGKGPHGRGAVWVARRVPDGYVCAHANQARIQTFPRDEPETTLFAPDVVEFARHIGAYNGTDAAFSFSDTYDPVTFAGARFCEARVYSFFEQVAAAEVGMSQYVEYALGHKLANRMPLFVKVGRKLSVNDTMWLMRNHYEGTALDPRNDVGSETWHAPNRLGEDLTWTSGDKRYVNERPIGTHYAAWNLVVNQRPKERFSLLWFGSDDSSFSLHAPFYGATSRVPPSWSGGNCTGRDYCRKEQGLPGSVLEFSMKAMHWVNQLVSNYAYTRYDVIAPLAQRKLAEIEAILFDQVRDMDAKLLAIDSNGDAAEKATQFSYDLAERLHETWQDFYGDLFATFVDGYTTVQDHTDPRCGCRKETPHWSEDWKQRIANSTGDLYKWQGTQPADPKYPATNIGQAPGLSTHLPLPPDLLIDKLSLPALGGKHHDYTAVSASDELVQPFKMTVSKSASLAQSLKGRPSQTTLDATALEMGSSALSTGTFGAVLLLSNLASIGLGCWLRGRPSYNLKDIHSAGAEQPLLA